MEFPRQEYQCGLPLPPPGALPDPGIEPRSLVSPALAGGFFTVWATRAACTSIHGSRGCDSVQRPGPGGQPSWSASSRPRLPSPVTAVHGCLGPSAEGGPGSLAAWPQSRTRSWWGEPGMVGASLPPEAPRRVLPAWPWPCTPPPASGEWTWLGHALEAFPPSTGMLHLQAQAGSWHIGPGLQFSS